MFLCWESAILHYLTCSMKLTVNVITLEHAKINDIGYMIENLGNALSFESNKMKYDSPSNTSIEYFFDKILYQFTILTSTRFIVDNLYLKFLSIFQFKLWLLLFFSIFIVAIPWMIYLDDDFTVLLPIISPLISQEFNLVQCFENSIDKLKRKVARLGMLLLTLIWLLSCQIISQAFVSMILSCLFLTKTQPFVETVEDLVKTDNIRIFHPVFDTRLNEYFIEFKPKIYWKLDKIKDDFDTFKKYRHNVFWMEEQDQLVRKILNGDYVVLGDEEFNIELLIFYKTNYPNLYLSSYKYNFMTESISLGRRVGNFKMIHNMYEIFF